MMTSAGLVRASVLLTAQTCIAANLPGVEDSRLGGPCIGSGHTDGEEKRTYTRLVSNLGLLSLPRSHWKLLTPIAARCPSGCLVQRLSLHFLVLDWQYHGSSSPLWSSTTYTHILRHRYYLAGTGLLHVPAASLCEPQHSVGI